MTTRRRLKKASGRPASKALVESTHGGGPPRDTTENHRFTKKGAAQGKGATKQGGNSSQDGVPTPYLSAITLNGNRPKYSTERHSVASWVDQQDPVISAAYQTPVLVGMQVGAASVENGTGVPPRITSRNVVLLLRTYPKKTRR